MNALTFSSFSRVDAIPTLVAVQNVTLLAAGVVASLDVLDRSIVALVVGSGGLIVEDDPGHQRLFVANGI